MDLEMPVMDGFEAAFTITNLFKSQQNKYIKCPYIVACTGYNSESLKHEQVVNSGFKNILTKPLLKNAIELLLTHIIEDDQ